MLKLKKHRDIWSQTVIQMLLSALNDILKTCQDK